MAADRDFSYEMEKERGNRMTTMMSKNHAREYLRPPKFSKFRRIEFENEALVRHYWKHSAKEMMNSSFLLPSKFKNEYTPANTKEIGPFKYKGKSLYHRIWHFYAFQNRGIKGEINVREIDVTGSNVPLDEEDTTETSAKEAARKYEAKLLRNFYQDHLLKELYMLHYFKHENLLYALYTRSTPKIYRMDIIFPRTCTLFEFALDSHKRKTNARYVSICILRALDYLHACNIVHENVSITNCFVDGNANVMLGGFEDVKISKDPKEQADDIWDVGALVLDFILRTIGFGIFFDSSMAGGYASLLEMFQFYDFTNNNDNQEAQLDIDLDDDEECMQSHARKLRDGIPRNSKLYNFLDIVLQTHHFDRPTARELLESDEYTAVEDEEFSSLKFAFYRKVKRFKMDEYSTLQIIPDEFKSDNTLPSLPDNATASDNDGYSDCSEYLSQIPNATKKFKDGSTINVSFTFKCGLYSPLKTAGSFVVGSEATMFELLMGLLDLKIDYEPKWQGLGKEEWKTSILMRKYIKAENVNFTLDPLYPVRAWDIIRLRTALHSMLSDIAMSDDSGYSTRDFVLCKLEGEILRKVKIEIECDRMDIVNIPKRSDDNFMRYSDELNVL